MSKKYDIHIRADENVVKKLKTLCSMSRGENQSKVIRKAIMNCTIEDINGKAEIISQLKKIGTNLNQITMRINAKQITDEGIILDQINNINLQLENALNHFYSLNRKPKVK